MSDKDIPVEVFQTAMDPHGRQKPFFVERHTVDGHLDSLPLLRWILEVDLDYAYADVSWRTGPYLIKCMDIIDLLQFQGRHKQIKKAGQIGECIHGNFGTETKERWPTDQGFHRHLQ